MELRKLGLEQGRTDVETGGSFKGLKTSRNSCECCLLIKVRSAHHFEIPSADRIDSSPLLPQTHPKGLGQKGAATSFSITLFSLSRVHTQCGA